MSKKQLPVAPAGRPCARVTCETLPSALDRWNGGIKAAATDDNSISVFDVIGQDYWGEGVTAKRIAGALRAMNGADVTVNINSLAVTCSKAWPSTTCCVNTRESYGQGAGHCRQRRLCYRDGRG